MSGPSGCRHRLGPAVPGPAAAVVCAQEDQAWTCAYRPRAGGHQGLGLTGPRLFQFWWHRGAEKSEGQGPPLRGSLAVWDAVVFSGAYRGGDCILEDSKRSTVASFI